MEALSVGITSSNTPIRPISVFKADGWQIAAWACKAQTLLFTGSAGGGKSHLAAEKLHAFCLKYPGSQALIARKVRVSLVNGTILFLEREVIGDDPRVKHVPSKSRFEYTNGSILSYIGIEDAIQRRRLRSIGAKGGIDIAWMEEATEFEQEDYDALLGRLRGKAAPWRQIILTTNPESPTHWIYIRLIQGNEAVVFESHAWMNKHNPEGYQGTLDQMTGVEGERLRDGKWVSATGRIYETWDENFNVTEQADYEQGAGSVYWGVDDGYVGDIDEKTGIYKANSHPRVFLLGQLRSNGTLNIFAEHYACKMLSENHIKLILDMGYPEPEYVVVDKSAAELKARLAERYYYIRNSPSSVEESIKVTRGWVSPDSNGVRRVLVHPRCKQLRSEMASYRRNPATQAPIKEFDHGPDALRYMIHGLQGYN